MNTKLLIEPIINHKPHGTIIQGERFLLEFKISNCGNTPSDKFNITSVKMKSAEGKDIFEDFDKKVFFVDVINPGESTILRIANSGQVMHGLVGINILVQLLEGSTKSITFLQKNAFTGEKSELLPENTWVDFLYIESKSNYLQEKTNTRLLVLTWMMAVVALIQLFCLLILD